MLLGVGAWSRTYLIAVALISVAHFLIDWIKIVVDRRLNTKYWPLGTFVTDQFLHLVAIGVVLAAFGIYDFQNVLDRLTEGAGDPRYLYAAGIYVASLFGGAIAVRITVGVFDIKIDQKSGSEGVGAYIGVIERVIIASLVALQQYSAVGFVFAAKSIARFKRMEESQEFAEYYIIGTLTSFVIAILAGLALQALFN